MYVSSPLTERVTARITRNRHNRLASSDSYAGFEAVTDRDHWYRMLMEVQSGWKVSQARKDPGVMETAMCHVVLLDAIVGSGLLDRYNHTQRTKYMMVSGREGGREGGGSEGGSEGHRKGERNGGRERGGDRENKFEGKVPP